MFTGIITDVGKVIAATPRETGIRLRIGSNFASDGIDMGASIAHAGICLTVVDKGLDGNRNWYDVEISPETLNVTTAGSWQVGTRLNLERSLTLGQEMGGHLVTGHVDGVAELIERTNDGDMAVLTFRVPESHARFIAAKGSICLDGTSLTVNSVGPDTLSVMLIPHTLTVTTWGDAVTGDHVNFEVDLMARYAARLMTCSRAAEGSLLRSDAFPLDNAHAGGLYACLLKETDNVDPNHCGQIDRAAVKGAHVLVVEARFYDGFADALLEGAKAVLDGAEVTYDVITVPGALEIPAVIAAALLSEEINEPKYDGYVVLGTVVRGATTHYEIVSNESARALMTLSIDHAIALGNGILTVENEDQAWERARMTELDKGGGAAAAALAMIGIRRGFGL